MPFVGNVLTPCIIMDKSLPNDIFFGLVTDQLEQGRTITIPLTGTSMSPTLQQGRDNLVLAPLSPNVPLRRYDVVLFRYRGAYILHRIMKIKGDTLVTRGDALVSTETPLRSDLVARLIAVKDTQTGKVTQCGTLRWKWLTMKGVFWKGLKRKIKRLIR